MHKITSGYNRKSLHVGLNKKQILNVLFYVTFFFITVLDSLLHRLNAVKGNNFVTPKVGV